MSRIRHLCIVFGMLVFLAPLPSSAQVGIRIWSPNLSIGIHIPVYPTLVLIPGYPVYYAPHLSVNYFFYDGLYWVFEDGSWYASSWYDGPWAYVDPYDVPLFILRIPVRYYHQPPRFLHGHSLDAPPPWEVHWGRDWQQHRRGWDQWNRGAVPAPAPLPFYQRQYTGERYPRHFLQQRELEQRHYRFQPRDPTARRYFEERSRQQRPPVRRLPPRNMQQERGPGQPDMRRPQRQDYQTYPPRREQSGPRMQERGGRPPEKDRRQNQRGRQGQNEDDDRPYGR